MVQRPVRNHAMRGNHKHYARMTHPHPHRHVVPTTVLTRSRLVPLNTARPVTTAISHTKVEHQRPTTHGVNKAHLPLRRPINLRPSPQNSNFHNKVTTVKATQVNVVQGVKGNWGNPHYALKDKGVIDSGCSRHMIGNISYLSNFEEINGGYVAIGGNPKGGKITRKDTECIVLSFDFKLPDENNVLLRVLRENNMYNVDLKNIIPSGDLTFLFAKATLDESNLWHRRLGHINSKTLNKLVKGNLVRGLPSKVFENNHTCVACKKGKQHSAFCLLPLSLKIRLLTQKKNLRGHTQEEGIDYEEVFALVAMIEAIRWMSKVLLCMEPLKRKSLYGLHRAPRAWYETLATYLLENGFQRGKIDQTLFIKKQKRNILLVQTCQLWKTLFIHMMKKIGAEADFSNLETNINVSPLPTTRVHKDHHVTQIIGDLSLATQTRSMTRTVKDQELCKAFEKLMKDKFQMSSMTELTFLLGLQEKQKQDRRFISQDKYVAKIFRKFGLTDGKLASTPIDTEKPLLKDPDGHTQEEGIDYEEVFALVAMIEAIRWMSKVLFCMEPLKRKSLYGLHRAPRAWYETLATYLLENGFQRGKIDQTLFIKKQKRNILLVQKLESEFWNHKMVGSNIDVYTARFHKLARLVPHMVTLESQHVNCYIRGLAPEIKPHVTSTEPATIQGAMSMANRLTTDSIKDGLFKKKENARNKKRSNDQNKNRGRDDRNKRQRT
nr:hypothetical protein [Tanacetum cinerariifolium]